MYRKALFGQSVCSPTSTFVFLRSIYLSKDAVWLSGGPQPMNNGKTPKATDILEEGDYFFAVLAVRNLRAQVLAYSVQCTRIRLTS